MSVEEDVILRNSNGRGSNTFITVGLDENKPEIIEARKLLDIELAIAGLALRFIKNYKCSDVADRNYSLGLCSAVVFARNAMLDETFSLKINNDLVIKKCFDIRHAAEKLMKHLRQYAEYYYSDKLKLNTGNGFWFDRRDSVVRQELLLKFIDDNFLLKKERS